MRTTAPAWPLPTVILAALAAVPFISGTWTVNLMTGILVLGLFAASLDLLLGVTGLPSLGHAAFFGVGGYAAGLVALHLTSSGPLQLLAATIAGLVTAVGTGWLALRARGVYFLMLTLAVAELIREAVSAGTSVTGGVNGLAGIPAVTLPGTGPLLQTGYTYLYVLAAVALGYGCLVVVTRSPFGQVLVAIRENEARTRAIGYAPYWYKLGAYAIAGALAGYAGALQVAQSQFVSPDSVGFLTSATALLSITVGGTGTLYGPFVGAAAIVLVRDQLSTYLAGHADLLLGAMFVSAVSLPEGPVMTTETNHAAATVYRQILDPANRHDPYPFFTELSRTPIHRLDTDEWLVTTYEEISRLLRDPRMSVEDPGADAGDAPPGSDGTPVIGPFLFRDPPHHDTLRRQTMKRFAPRIIGMRPHIETLVTRLLDTRAGTTPGRLDVVAELAYPLPVGVICELLGVPPEDEPVFHSFAGRLTKALDPVETLTEQEIADLAATQREWREYLMPMIAQRSAQPGTDLISALLTEGDPATRMTLLELGITLGMLLIAGHETTVNLIANGTLALLRNPAVLARLRADPELAPAVVEEVLRYDPPVQLTGRRATADIDVAGHTVRAGQHVRLLLAAGNRDPRRFTHPDVFWPERPGNAHLAFGGGVHYCFGAALARMEAQAALTAIATRLDNPGLADDPPRYRPNTILRGPAELPITYDALTR